MTLVYTNVKKEDLDSLKDFVSIELKSKYEQLRLKKDNILLILYSSGKLVVQTNDEKKAQKILSNLERVPMPNKTQMALTQNIIGTDESLKGDTFGGLIVAGFYCKQENVETLKKFKIKDSKQLSDEQIIKFAEFIKRQYPNCYFIYEMYPTQYNDLISIKTITQLMNDMHQIVGEKLKVAFPNTHHVVDKFPGCTVGDIQETRAESRYLAVATASILARARAIEQIQTLERKAKFKIPFGSTHVTDALNELKLKNLNPRDFCKVEFKNVKKIFDL